MQSMSFSLRKTPRSQHLALMPAGCDAFRRFIGITADQFTLGAHHVVNGDEVEIVLVAEVLLQSIIKLPGPILPLYQ